MYILLRNVRQTTKKSVKQSTIQSNETTGCFIILVSPVFVTYQAVNKRQPVLKKNIFIFLLFVLSFSLTLNRGGFS